MSIILTQAQLAITPPTHNIMDIPDEVSKTKSMLYFLQVHFKTIFHYLRNF